MRQAQLSFGDGLIAVEVEDLLEEWMKHAEELLNDEQLVATVFEALAKRRPNSRSRGRPATPAEVVLRLLILRRVRNWSYNVLEREVRANLVYRKFTHVGAAKMPDAKTMGGWGRALGPQVIKQVHERIVQIAQAKQVVEGRRMRVDTTVTETNIHYPTDSSLLGDGVRVLTRTMKKITKIAGEVEPNYVTEAAASNCGSSILPGQHVPRPRRARADSSRTTANCSSQPAGSSVKPNNFLRKLLMASSGRRIRWSNWRSKAYARKLTPWYRALNR
jgi:hypothetical protein